MKRKAFFLVLAIVCIFSLLPATLAAESVTPTPPEWIEEEDYIIFPGARAYRPTYWNYILELRADAAAGNLKPKQGEPLFENISKLSSLMQGPYGDSAAGFEYGLIELMYHKNGGYPAWSDSDLFYSVKQRDADSGGPNAAKLALWSARSMYQIGYHAGGEEDVSSIAEVIDKAMAQNGLRTLDQFLNWGTLDVSEEEYRRLADILGTERDIIYVYLDGEEIVPAGGYHQLPECLPAQARNGRTLVPIRAVSEALGAKVEWLADTNQIRLSRAGDEIVMTLGETAAIRNGTGFQMDVAPFAEEGTTFVPVRYIAEFFGQTVEWDGPGHRVLVTENKTVAEGANVEAWALAMGAVSARLGGEEEPGIFGSMHRAKTYSQPTGNGLETIRVSASNEARYLLESGWGITDREALTVTVKALTDSQGTVRERPQLAWDLFRASSLAQWGYEAGFVTYAEALALIEPAAGLTAQNFSSWEEAYENYLYGYQAWEEQDMTGQDVWQTQRGKFYSMIKENPATASVLDDTLFQTGVIGLKK